MSNQQQALIADTILGLRKAVKRKAYDSDSDSSIEHNTNRGHKLKKRARFAHEGRLAPPTGPASYKEVIEHAGFTRAIISRNPLAIDEEGYEVDSEDEDERAREALAIAADANPYSSIQLEHLLAPLTAVTDLPSHPTLSRPFTSKVLTELATQGSDLMHKENEALWKVKPLLTKLNGDLTWASCNLMISETDGDLFPADYTTATLARILKKMPKSSTAESTTTLTNGEGPKSAVPDPAANETGDVPTEEHKAGSEKDPAIIESTAQSIPEANGEANTRDGEQDVRNGEKPVDAATKQDLSQAKEAKADAESRPAEASADGAGEQASVQPQDDTKAADAAKTADGDAEMAEAAAINSAAVAHNEKVSAGVSQDGAGSATPSGSDQFIIHPLFVAPKSAHPDRDLGLPDPEAEDVRRLVQLYVQKQEEICRGTTKLYEGLRKADRLRKTVLKWAKAEAHCGPNRVLSDGEDWYDKEEWGLAEDLKKGQDEEEEDTTQTHKKTRNRR